jgi:hypothetical protein
MSLLVEVVRADGQATAKEKEILRTVARDPGVPAPALYLTELFFPMAIMECQVPFQFRHAPRRVEFPMHFEPGK